MPTRGKALKIGMRVDWRPVAWARQNGEFALRARSSGRCTRMPFATWIALSGASTPTCTCWPKISSWRGTKSSAAIRSRWREGAAKDQLVGGEEAQRGDQVGVARAGDDPLVLPHGEGVRARRADREPVPVRRRLDAAAQLAELVAGLARVAGRRGRDLEHGL